MLAGFALTGVLFAGTLGAGALALGFWSVHGAIGALAGALFASTALFAGAGRNFSRLVAGTIRHLVMDAFLILNNPMKRRKCFLFIALRGFRYLWLKNLMSCLVAKRSQGPLRNGQLT